jgi:hypothetical protein
MASGHHVAHVLFGERSRQALHGRDPGLDLALEEPPVGLAVREAAEEGAGASPGAGHHGSARGDPPALAVAGAVGEQPDRRAGELEPVMHAKLVTGMSDHQRRLLAVEEPWQWHRAILPVGEAADTASGRLLAPRCRDRRREAGETLRPGLRGL